MMGALVIVNSESPFPEQIANRSRFASRGKQLLNATVIGDTRSSLAALPVELRWRGPNPLLGR